MKIFPTSEKELDMAADLRNGLSKLSPEDNFRGFLWEGSLAPGEEIRIPNGMRDGRVPRGVMFLQVDGQPSVVKGAGGWTNKIVTLKNTASTSTVTVKAYFYR